MVSDLLHRVLGPAPAGMVPILGIPLLLCSVARQQSPCRANIEYAEHAKIVFKVSSEVSVFLGNLDLNKSRIALGAREKNGSLRLSTP